MYDYVCSSCSADLASSGEETSTPGGDVVFSQSCDLDLHQPTRLEGDAEHEPVAEGDQAVVVDEEAIQHSMELSQRLSEDAMSKSCDQCNIILHFFSTWHVIREING